MKTKSLDRTKLFKNFGFAGIALCAICCALPLLGAVFGMATLTVLATYFEWAGLAALLLAVVLLVIWVLRSKKAPACDVDCSCRTQEVSVDK